jgi:tetratricopeptide (TPR) repeat protein
MDRSSVVLLLALSTAIPSLAFLENSFAATPETLTALDSAALTAEADALLDEWRGQGNILDLAAQKLIQAVKRNPDYAKAYVQICRLHIMAGFLNNQLFEPLALQTAERAILKAIQLDPADGYAYVLKGHLYTNLGRLAEAKAALSMADNVGTDSPWLKLNWAAIFELEGDFDRAAANYRDVIASGTTNRKALGSAYEDLAGYYLMKHQWVNADEVHRAHIKLEPTNAWARGNYASWLANKGQFERAIPHAREALQLMDYGAARNTLAVALYGTWATMITAGKDPSQAQPYFDEAHQIRPDLDEIASSTSRYSGSRIIAQVLVKQGLVKGAIQSRSQ